MELRIHLALFLSSVFSLTDNLFTLICDQQDDWAQCKHERVPRYFELWEKQHDVFVVRSALSTQLSVVLI